MDWRRYEADKAHPNTCTWILQHKSYTNWLSKQRGLLWIKGKPGAGKSTLLAYIYRIIQETTSDQADLSLEFFFHGRGAALQKTSIGMFRSLLHQLYTRDSSTREPIRKAFHDKEVFGEVGTGWEWQLRELQDLFFSAILAAAKFRKIIIFIDALDEAGPDAKDLVDYFHGMNDQLNEAKSTAAICISCRHYPITAVIPGLDVLVEENNHDDISLYVQVRLRSNFRVDQNEADSKAWSEIEKKIVKDASGVFQWARLVVTMVLEQYEEGESWDDIQLMLAKVPRELGAVYEHILNNIIKPERRKRTLHLMQWVFLAERPLTLDELRHAMAFDDIHVSSSMHLYQDTKRYLEMYGGMYKLVNSLSGGLAEVKRHDKEDIVQFIHQSVNDFLLSTGLEFLVSKTADIPPGQDTQEIIKVPTNLIVGQGQDRLSRSCVNYLRLAEINWKKIVPDIGPKQLRLPFIEYAAKFWFVHAGKAEQNGISQEYLVEQFGSTGQLFEKWMKICPIVDKKSTETTGNCTTFLQITSGSNLRSVVRLLLQEGVLVEAEDRFGDRALHYAARGGYKEVVEMLLKANATPEAKNEAGITPIERAAGNGHHEIVELLLKNGSNIRNALQAAAQSGSTSLVKFLLNSGADINTSGGAHGNALQAAAINGHENVVQLLIDEGAEINLQGGEDGSALQAAATKGYEYIVQLLLDSGADVHLQGGSYGNALQGAIVGSNRVIIEAILDKGADVNAQGGFFGTPLQAAAQGGDMAVFELLLDKGANVNTNIGQHGNPLQAACERGRLACAKLLLKRGGDVNAESGLYGNPLNAAAFSGNIKLVELLLQNGAKINAQAGHFGTALQAAVSSGGLKIIELLLQKGAEINAESGYYGTALQAAAAKGRVDATELLLENGADANVKGGVYGSAIQAAATTGTGFLGKSTTRTLLDHGADVNVQGGKYSNALQAAIVEGDIHIVYLLLRHGAIFDPQDEEFSAALIAAVENSTLGVECMLAERGYIVREGAEYLVG
jgi:ankyrin repeat protein